MKWRILSIFTVGLIYAIVIFTVYLILGYKYEFILKKFPGIYLLFLLGILSGMIHYICVKRLPYVDKKDAMQTHHRRLVILHEPFERSFDLCLYSLSQVKGLKKPVFNKDEGVIKAKTGMNWKTFEDKITFKLVKEEKGMTKVEISSRPSYFISKQIFDCGRNLENIETIMDYFRISGFLYSEKIIMGKSN